MRVLLSINLYLLLTLTHTAPFFSGDQVYLVRDELPGAEGELKGCPEAEGVPPGGQPTQHDPARLRPETGAHLIHRATYRQR